MTNELMNNTAFKIIQKKCLLIFYEIGKAFNIQLALVCQSDFTSSAIIKSKILVPNVFYPP